MFRSFRNCFGKTPFSGPLGEEETFDDSNLSRAPGADPDSPAEQLISQARSQQLDAQDIQIYNSLDTRLASAPAQPPSAANRLTQPQVLPTATHNHEAPDPIAAEIPTAQVQLPVTGLAPVAASNVTPSSAAGLNASRIRSLQSENVVYCDPLRIMEGVTLSLVELGRGSFGIVVPGNYRGVACAVKIMLTMGGLDRAALHELLLGPTLVHPNVVATYLSRCAILTHAFFDFLEGERGDPSIPPGQRLLDAPGTVSGDGFGDPSGMEAAINPMKVLHQALYALEAATGQTMVVVIQQYCDKGTLKQAIEGGYFRPGPEWSERLAIRSLLRTAAELARGLLHLHDSGVVHGDFKPANVLLQSSKEDRRGYVAKIADFGLCHVLPLAANSIMTASWGSIAYMTPEALDGKVSRAMDVWALGVVIWEMVVGKKPYGNIQECELATTLRRLREGSMTLAWPAEATTGVWAPLAALGQRCMSYAPGDRHPMEVVVDQLVAIERDVRAATLAART